MKPAATREPALPSSPAPRHNKIVTTLYVSDLDGTLLQDDAHISVRSRLLLDEMIRNSQLAVQVIRVADHDAAIKAMENKQATAYAADRTVLIALATTSDHKANYELSRVQFSYEPYGLMMRRDPGFRLLVDRTLARLYRSGEIQQILTKWFSGIGTVTEGIMVMTQLNALPE